VVAAALLIVYEILFPIYESLLLHPGNYGSLAGFAILILVFFYYLSFILLLGLEINAWAQGQRSATDELVIFTQPEKATKAPQNQRTNDHTSGASQRTSSQRPSLVARGKADAESATAAITRHGSQGRGGQTAPQPKRATKRRQANGPAPRVISRAPTNPYSAGTPALDEPPAIRRFSLTTTLAAGLTALSVIAIQFARRPRHT
jgi:hypothetical protein